MASDAPDDARLFYRDGALPTEADSHHLPGYSGKTAPTLGELVAAIRDNVVGDDEVIATPFGPRRIVYCDWTASGRSLYNVEDYVMRQVLSLYANTHSLSSKLSQQTACFRLEARQIVQLGCNANPPIY